ncbi:SGNH/GDSL hydrolase family protein, partial [Xanthomonas sp. Kuri4-1]
DELAAGLDAAAPQGPFALVTLLIGVNNQYRDRPLDAYRQQFAALLARAIGYAGDRAARVLVLSIPDWGVTPYAHAQGRDAAATAQAIDRFNRVAADACAAQGVAFVDITGYSRAHGAEPAMLVADGLHPSARMYAGWTALTLPEALRAFTCTADPSPDLPT